MIHAPTVLSFPSPSGGRLGWGWGTIFATESSTQLSSTPSPFYIPAGAQDVLLPFGGKKKGPPDLFLNPPRSLEGEGTINNVSRE
jgi:hypothetical protein